MRRAAAVWAAAGAVAAMLSGAPRVAARQEAAAARMQESVPRLVQFNGTLKDSAARAVSGVASVTFAVYTGQDGGSALWSETQNVLSDANGHYSVLLGSATAGGFPAELVTANAAASESRWLGVTIARQPEMPRVLLASVPYALKAGDADTLGGLPASSYVTAQQLAARTAIAAPSTTIITGTGAGATQTTPGTATSAATLSGGATDAATQSVTQAAVTGTGTAQYLPLWTSGSNLGVSKIYQAAGGFVGINTNTPLLQLDVNGNSIFRGSFQMAPQGTATASAGQPSHSFQWQASLYDSSKKAPVTEAFGFRTVPATNDVAGPTAKLDLFYGPGGGTLNDTGLSISNTGLITFAPGQVFTGSAVTASTLTLPYSLNGTPNLITLGGVSFLSNGGSSSNTFLGQAAGTSASGSNDTGIGAGAMYYTSGENDTALGVSALYSNSSGSNNTTVGQGAMFHNTSGDDNVAVGYNALGANTTSDLNVAIGFNALDADIGGNYNTAVGAFSAQTANGIGNTLIGRLTDASAGVSFSTAIGDSALVTEDSALVLGGSGVSAVNVGIGTSAPISTLDIESQTSAGLANPSPVLTLTNDVGGEFSATAVDFNPDPVSTSGSYNPWGRFSFADEGNSSGAFVWYQNKPGALNNGLQQNMSLDANGNLTVRGNLVKGGGSFKIDDPIDPAGKYLSHSFVESPDMMNIYNGIVTLDAHGAAVVTMPEWFSALNRDFRYTLTAIGSPAPKLFIADELHDNCFRIAGGKKGQRVSWQITGIRQDAYANAHRIPTEEDKPASEQGHYLHPELFGAGAEKAVGAGASVIASGAELGVAQTGTGKK
jgi:hypothetical protein